MKSPQRTKQELRNDKECASEHQNQSLPNKPVCCPSQDKSLAKFRQLKDCVPFIEHNARHSTRTTPLRTNAYTTKISCCRLMISNWTAIRLCVLLVLLHWTSIVSGSNMEIYQPGLPSSEEILKSLKKIGFSWSFNGTNPRVVFCSSEETPESTPTPDVTDNTNPNSTQPNSSLRYAIVEPTLHLYYTLPIYPDSPAIALHEIRKITMINAEDVEINYNRASIAFHKECLVLLCRLLNLFVCKELKFTVNYYENLDKYKGGFDLDRGRKEAKNAIDWDDSTPFHLTINSDMASNALLKYIFNGLVILRPVSGITLPSKYVPDLSGYLKPLSLSSNYTLIIRYEKRNVKINLKRIQKAAHKCAKIIFDIHEVSDPVITGLEEEVPAKSPTIILTGSGHSIQYIAKHNRSRVKVHVLVYNTFHSGFIKSLIKAAKAKKASKSRIVAGKAILALSDSTPCDFPAYHKQVLTTETFAKSGIAVKDIEFKYEDGRWDFSAELESLVYYKVLSEMPTNLAGKNIVCLGHALSDPCWELKEVVDLKLNKFGLWPICPNIRYTTLSISGDKNPDQNHTCACNGLLRHLRSINAQELRISNVRDCPSTNTNFDMAKLESDLANLLKHNLNVEILILDDVDECILYRMLGCYDFTCSKLTEIHLLNHRFTSLAIAQILTLPMAKKISKLVIDGISRLNEIKHFHQRKELNEFSLFNYLEKRKGKRKGKKETEEIDLHKLVLRPEPTIFDSYNIPLQALRGLGVQVLTSSDKYSTDPPFPRQPHMIDMKEFAYYTTTFDALKIDLAKYQSTSLTQPNPTLTLTPIPNSVQPDSITTMFLRINDTQFLTQADLNTIICWVSCRFKNITSLWLANFKLTEEDRKILASCKYMINALPYLQFIQIEDATSDKDPLELSLHPYYNNLLEITSDPMPTFLAVSYKVLSQLYTYCDKIEDLIPNYDSSNATLHTIITSLQKLKRDGDVPYCPCCNRTLYMPPQGKRAKKWDIKRLFTMKFNSQFNSNTNIDMLFYLGCGCPVCIRCLEIRRKSHAQSCTKCKQNTGTFNRLIGIPSPVFIFPNNSACDSNAHSELLQPAPWKDNHCYFYLSYNSIESLIDALYKQPPTHVYHTQCREVCISEPCTLIQITSA
ncbi:hypothetical protein NEHOM01_2466 [Nematocida homosporus]|uniref:uncharacterized protein n=1 Tax=Nematocida homosporus TaxID=1912981 RepID=UPI00221E6040|nr:uncharacterized protein NEHOM01_2466 [Nematocida homosporus]KAI5187968.1 hypothetical protein NEHOM01_2466 [Nematocida homosporus]